MFNGYKTVKKRLYTENILLIINIHTAYLVISDDIWSNWGY